MSDKAKIPLLIALILLSLLLASTTYYLLQRERAKNLALQEELEDVKTKHKIAEKKLQESQKIVSELELKLQEANTRIETLTTTLNEEKMVKEQALTQIEELKTDLEQQQELKSNLETKFAQIQEDMKNLEAQLKRLKSEKVQLETKIQDLEAQVQAGQAKTEQPSSTQEGGVELGKIVVSPEEKTFPSGLEGKVLVINKDYNFAVINLGSKDGIAVGNVFSIYHNNKYIGDAKVEKVHDSMSAIGFASLEMKDKVSEGDKVVKKD